MNDERKETRIVGPLTRRCDPAFAYSCHPHLALAGVGLFDLLAGAMAVFGALACAVGLVAFLVAAPGLFAVAGTVVGLCFALSWVVQARPVSVRIERKADG